MRKIIPFLLLASAVPAMASAQDQGGWRHSSQSNQSSQFDNHPQRAERAEARQQAREQFQVQRQAQVSAQGNAGAFAAMRERYQAQQQAQQAQQGDSIRAERMQRYQQMQAQQQGESIRAERMQRFQQMQAQQQNEALRTERMNRYQQVQNGVTADPRSYRSFTGTNSQGVQAPTRYDRNSTTRWTNNWRDDRRYDWRDYRQHHRSTFHIGLYFDPFGYGYQRYGIGSFLYPSYYQSNFWINDPWQYRLPPVYGPYRWVRYHDDALLIDIWSGEVVDVIYDFFW